MARKVELSLEALAALGAEKLAALVLGEAEGNAAYAKRAKAALVAGEGVDAVAALIDRRLASLERARAMVAWERERGLAADLGAIVDTIEGELGERAPALAVQNMLRFIDTHVRVFERIDDSGGRIQAVYWRGADLIPGLVQKLPLEERGWVTERLLVSLAKDTHGLARAVSVAVAPLLPPGDLAGWDEVLAGIKSGEGEALDVRQAIADARGDIDGYLHLEARKPTWRQNPLAAAERLLAAGRLDEALIWVRREKKGGLAVMTAEDLADGTSQTLHDLERVRLEARILEEMGELKAAQTLRLATFAKSFNADLLREYLSKVEDFSEHDEQERAFAVALVSERAYAALRFFVVWPRLDLAAKLVMAKRDIWDGRNYDVLPSAAAELEYEFPVAATILYRALLDNILARAKSQAYGHGVRYLTRLAALGTRLLDDGVIEAHEAYLAGLKQTHGRKAGFWIQAAQTVEASHKKA